MKLIALVIILGMSACTTKERTYTEKERDARVDSIFAQRVVEIDRMAAEDLDRRMAIEVKAKTDSILEAAVVADRTATNARRP